jgi:Icc protein
MKFIQLTDFHLFSNQEKTMHGYCTYECLKIVIDAILQNVNLKADAVFITGDISEDRSIESYVLALSQVQRLNLPIYLLAGNHDNKECMASVFNKSKLVFATNEFSYEDWIFIKVDTVQQGKDSGFLSIEQKNAIADRISAVKSQKVGLFMHHHPIPVGIPLVDSSKLLNSESLLDLLVSRSEIKSVICGHAHTLFTRKYNKCTIDVCPATCFQWKSGAQTLLTDNKRGYKVLDFSYDYHSETFFV